MRIPLLLTACVVATGCGGADQGSSDPAPTQAPERRTTNSDDGTSAQQAAGKGTTVVARRSEFGLMLFGSNGQAIYIFENDPPRGSVCYGDCAEAWPPVLTKGAPQAARGVNATLLGTIQRRDGGVQVTYNGKPLYFYAHEAPGEVRCHNVDLNGGLWWVVGPDGKKRP